MSVVVNPHIRFVYEDYKALPESMARQYELLDGEILMVPAPTTRHRFIAGNIHALLHTHVRRRAKSFNPMSCSSAANAYTSLSRPRFVARRMWWLKCFHPAQKLAIEPTKGTCMEDTVCGSIGFWILNAKRLRSTRQRIPVLSNRARYG